MHDIHRSMSFLGAVTTLTHGSWNVVAIDTLTAIYVYSLCLDFNHADVDRYMIAIACILVTACMTRGPLFQRALIVQNVSRSEIGSVDIQSASFLPQSFFSLSESQVDASAGKKLSSEFRETAKSMNNPISNNLSHIPCSHDCTSSIKVRRRFER